MRTGTNETETILAFSEFTETGAEIALQPTVIEPVPVSSGNSADSGCFYRACVFIDHQRDIGAVGRDATFQIEIRGWKPPPVYLRIGSTAAAD
jgi:hypothetical protein